MELPLAAAAAAAVAATPTADQATDASIPQPFHASSYGNLHSMLKRAGADPSVWGGGVLPHRRPARHHLHAALCRREHSVNHLNQPLSQALSKPLSQSFSQPFSQPFS